MGHETVRYPGQFFAVTYDGAALLWVGYLPGCAYRLYLMNRKINTTKSTTLGLCPSLLGTVTDSIERKIIYFYLTQIADALLKLGDDRFLVRTFGAESKLSVYLSALFVFRLCKRLAERLCALQTILLYYAIPTKAIGHEAGTMIMRWNTLNHGAQCR